MARLLLGNLEPGATDEDIRAFLVKYGFPPFDAIEREPGDGTRPGAVVTFTGVDPSRLTTLQDRIHSMFWNKRKLSARILHDRFA
jgi:hypothetical protein